MAGLALACTASGCTVTDGPGVAGEGPADIGSGLEARACGVERVLAECLWECTSLFDEQSVRPQVKSFVESVNAERLQVSHQHLRHKAIAHRARLVAHRFFEVLRRSGLNKLPLSTVVDDRNTPYVVQKLALYRPV